MLKSVGQFTMNNEPQPDRTAILALPDDALLTPQEIAVLLSVHPNTVLKLAKAQKLPCFALPLSQKRKIWRARKADLLNHFQLGAPSQHAGQLSAAKVPVPVKKGAANGHSK